MSDMVADIPLVQHPVLGFQMTVHKKNRSLLSCMVLVPCSHSQGKLNIRRTRMRCPQSLIQHRTRRSLLLQSLQSCLQDERLRLHSQQILRVEEVILVDRDQ